jgi:hypothetical protein
MMTEISPSERLARRSENLASTALPFVSMMPQHSLFCDQSSKCAPTGLFPRPHWGDSPKPRLPTKPPDISFEKGFEYGTKERAHKKQVIASVKRLGKK